MFRGFVVGNSQPHQRVVVLTATGDTATRSRCRSLSVYQVFDRSTEHSQLMDYCMAQSVAQAKAASALGRFPPGEPSPSALHRADGGESLLGF